MARPETASTAAPADRLVCLDAYRGFTMLAMASGGLGLVAVARRNEAWKGIANQFDHVRWEGCVFWDLIQPSFMFIVGVAMVFSFAARQGKGQSLARQWLHAIKRAGLLCLVGMFLDWYGDGRLYPQFIRVLQQIAIGYVICFAVLPLGPKVQIVSAIFLLVGHTAAFMIYGHLNGLADPFEAFNNIGRRIDLFLHIQNSFDPNNPGNMNAYVTLNAISSAATILFGMLAGNLLKQPGDPMRKLGQLVAWGACFLILGWALSGGGGWIPWTFHPFIPMVKKLWTASFAIFAAGWTLWMLAAFYLLTDLSGWKKWPFPFIVVGMNSIAMYVISTMFKSNAKTIANLIVPPTTTDATILAKRRLCDVVPQVDVSTWQVRWGVDLSTWYLTPLLESVIILTIFWLVCYWLYRRKIFFKL